MTRSREPFDVSLVIHGASKAALLVNETGEVKDGKPVKGVWIPRSEMTLSEAMELKLLRYEDKPARERGTLVLTMTVPEWLAYDRGLM